MEIDPMCFLSSLFTCLMICGHEEIPDESPLSSGQIHMHRYTGIIQHMKPLNMIPNIHPSPGATEYLLIEEILV